MNYTCNRCKKIFNHKGHFLNHINRKRPCNLNENSSFEIINNNNILKNNISDNLRSKNGEKTGISGFLRFFNETSHLNYTNDCDNDNLKLTCEYCNKVFRRKDYIIEHIKENRCKIKKQLDNNNKKKDNLIELLIEQKKCLFETKKQNEELKYKINKLEKIILANTGKITNKITKSNINCNNINNIIVKFGSEDINLLTDEEKQYICSKGYSSAVQLIKMLHCNPKYPQNHNVYISDRKFKHALVYNGNKFLIEDADKIVDQLLDNSSIYLEDITDTLQLNSSIRQKLEKLIMIIQASTDPKFIAEKKREIKIILYNNREMILKTIENKLAKLK